MCTPAQNPQSRPAAVAGLFYPDNAAELRTLLDQLLATESIIQSPAPKALIVPHAGYVYSGPIAAKAYTQLRPLRAQIKRVVLLGPSHRVPLQGLAYSTATAFQTPLGLIPVDQQALIALHDLPQLQALDQAHAQEHSLEVHLPFLQAQLDRFSLVPLVVGNASAEHVSEVLERLWGGPETLLIISTDLSHYHDYHTAQAMDQATCRAIEALRGQDIQDDQACGRIPLRGLLLAARRRGLHVQTLDLRNSGDTAGPRDQVVGYGAWALSEAVPASGAYS
jgi:AmmeMemoRadiSam system protein B